MSSKFQSHKFLYLGCCKGAPKVSRLQANKHKIQRKSTNELQLKECNELHHLHWSQRTVFSQNGRLKQSPCS